MEEHAKDLGKGIKFPVLLQNPMDLLSNPWGGLKVLGIVGMAGIGKTTLAYEIFQQWRGCNPYKFHVWVRVGPEYYIDQIWRSILRQVDPRGSEMVEDGNERSRVIEIIADKKYMIVFDDVWDSELMTLGMRELFKVGLCRSRSAVVLTTRLQHVTRIAHDVIQVPFLNKEESWDLLRQKVFDEMSCPVELEDPGKKIAENCDGLPLTIVAVAAILARDDQRKTPEHWNRIAEKSRHPVFMEAYGQIYKVLYPSYVNIPLSLRQSFLYMGVFPLKHEIRASKLIMLWNVENILEADPSKTSARVAVECLEDLHSRNLVLNLQGSSNGGIKTCRLHSVFWYFCYRLGQESSIFKVLDSYDDCLVEDMERQNRLSFYNNTLFGIIDFCSLIDPLSPVRSLLCFGPYHRYEVPICSHLRFLKVLDVLSIRFYDFPIQVVNLNELKYLALTSNTDLPPTISKLKFLEFLIVLRHQRIKSSRALVNFLPMEMWDMKEMKHLQVTGSDLPDPVSPDKFLPNLLTLLDVGPSSCTKNILERIPNLEKFGIRIELSPNGVETPSSSFVQNDIAYLKKLRSLKCVIVNPTLTAPPPLPNLLSGLRKLSLSGLGYPWKEMRKFASLPNLEVLKLRCYAFRGPKWESREDYYCEFKRLKYLLIEDTDLVEWVAFHGCFFSIRRIILRNCYRLKDIPTPLWWRTWIELDDCPLLSAPMPVRGRNIHTTNSWEKKGVAF